MDIFSLILISIALAMDCFAISIICGILSKGKSRTNILRISVLFGLFQAMMPFIGWLGTKSLAEYIQSFDHWVAFGLLCTLGVRMILESLSPESHKEFDPERLVTQLSLAVATSIDALAVGISFACTGYRTAGSLIIPLVLIGTVSFIAGIAGNLLGRRFGNTIKRRFRPELLGGVILIAIGIKILFEHLSA